MSRSHGVGQPLWARCWQCRRNSRRERRERYFTDHRGFGNRMELTGRCRYNPNYNGGRVDVFYQYEYKCLDCGHIGWTRHIDTAQRWINKYGLPEATAPR